MAISKIVTNSISDNSITSSKFAISAQISTPTITSPANNATGILNTQLITASPFLSLYGIAQANALFQISTSPTFAFINVASTITGSNTQFQANGSSGLVTNTAHFARVRYSDTSNNSSAFSDTIQFTTAAAFPFDVDFLVIAGGGGGGNGLGSSTYASSGGGAGGYRTSVSTSGGGAVAESFLTLVIATDYTVTVGGGGAISFKGSNSVFSTINSNGGGSGAPFNAGSTINGGSGGGGGDPVGTGGIPAGTGTSGQGFGGGAAGGQGTAGGGGGAGAAGSGPAGGTGVASTITGTSVFRGGGGRGGNSTTVAGGAGGGGTGGPHNNATAGSPNTGGGGGGTQGPNGSTQFGKAGGSGVVILKYPDDKTISNPGGGLTLSTATANGFSVTTVTVGTGNVQFN